MTTVVAQTSPPSSIRCGNINPTSNIDDDHHHGLHQNLLYTPPPSSSLVSVALDPFRDEYDDHLDTDTEGEQGEERKRKRRRERGVDEGDNNNLSVLALFVTAFRKSLVRCYNKGDSEGSISVPSSTTTSPSSWRKMEIGVPTNVRHVAHVTFDRFNGFLGLPVEFEPDVLRRAPSASATVFGVSTNSMQLSFDSRGNSVPTILLMMQRRLYALGGLEVEGIFRITAGNDQEEYVRDQLNRGVIPDDADVHCLAGLIKAWFRELPTGLLDTLSPEQLMECQTEEECALLARHLPSTEASLLDWAVNLMADVVQYEHLNKMNARNVAVVFAPNMTHVLDPLTALMHAVQVMNFLKTLITRTLREREDYILDAPRSSKDGLDESDPRSPLQTILEETREEVDEDDNNNMPYQEKPPSPRHQQLVQDDFSAQKGDVPTFFNSIENILPGDSRSPSVNSNGSCQPDHVQATNGSAEVPSSKGSSSGGIRNKPGDNRKIGSGESIKGTLDKAQRKGEGKINHIVEKAKGTNIVSRLNPRSERIEAWR